MIIRSIVNPINSVRPQTIEKLQREIKLENKPTHRVIRIYSDGKRTYDDVPYEKVFYFIAYNAVFRPEASIFVDGILVHVADKTDPDSALALARKAENTGLCFCTPAPKCYSMMAV